jgi:hypothetical protein
MNDPATILVLLLAAWKAVEIVLWLSRKLLPAVAFAVLITAAHAGDVEAALADRAQFPPADWWRYRWVDLSMVEPENRQFYVVALNLVMPAMAPRQQNLDECVLVEVNPWTYRFDIGQAYSDGTVTGLGWDYAAWRRVAARNPYNAHDDYFMLPGPWLLLQLSDQHESPAYYELTFGGKAPKTIDEALAFLQVNQDKRLQFGIIEGRSGVSVTGVRRAINFATYRGWGWGTFDQVTLAADQDPAEQLEGDNRIDGQEWIIGVVKVADGKWGGLPVFLLSDGKGNIVARAPVDLVKDHTRFRGLDEIRVPGGCWQCHDQGLNYFTQNEVRMLRDANVRIGNYDERQAEEVERLYLSDLLPSLKRANEDYAVIVEAACGCEPAEASLAFRSAINLYDAPLDLEDAARELGRDPEELRHAISAAGEYGILLGARAKGLAEGLTEPRKAFEGDMLVLEAACEAWEQAQ